MAIALERQEALSKAHTKDFEARKRFLEIGGDYHASLKTGSAPIDQGLLLAKPARYCCDWPWTRRTVSYLNTLLDSLE
jgi:hypothetical protein